MISYCLPIAVTAAVLHAAALGAIDLHSIDRSIVKEPAYQTKEPKYCLALFGEKAQTRVWMVLDGDTLYLDRNGNLDLTDAGESVKGKETPTSPGEFEFDAVAIKTQPGVPPNARIQVRVFTNLTFVYCHTDKLPWQRAVVDQRGYLMFGSKPENAPVLHFNGPITIGLRFDHRFKRGGKPEDLDIFVGTPGLGVGSFVRFGHDGVNPSLRPHLEIAFPSGAGQTSLKMTLDKRC